MITPRFTLHQDDKTLSIKIRAPYCKLSELDISVDENMFIFFCQPYYLRLQLPGKIEETDNSSSFDSDIGEFIFTYEKCNSGEHFPDLELITKFLSSKVEVEEGNRKIEILHSDTETYDVEERSTEIKYGFGMRGGYNFSAVRDEFKDIFLIDPHNVALEARCKLRQQMEVDSFDSDHYIADLFDNEELQELLQLKTPWHSLVAADVQFTTRELDFLKDLPNLSYNLKELQIKYCHNSLIDILYAYCYDRRTTYFEGTCESSWTISKICASLSCFDSFLCPKEALICAFRRSLIYPLYREFNLCQMVFNDLKMLLALGEQYIIKCLIDIYYIFITGDNNYYILNNLFVKDYIVYVMKWDKTLWHKVVEEVNKVIIQKNDLGLNLVNIEESIVFKDINNAMSNLNIVQDSDTDSDDTSSNCTECLYEFTTSSNGTQ